MLGSRPLRLTRVAGKSLLFTEEKIKMHLDLRFLLQILQAFVAAR